MIARVRRIHGHLPLALLGLALARPVLTSLVWGAALVLVGMALRVWASGFIEKGRDLCTDGPYRCVRHPLYLGSLIGAVGFAVMMNVIWGWILILPLFLLLYAAQMMDEERDLRATYGDTHTAFARAVPMLLPLPGRGSAGSGKRWNTSRLLANREHYHVAVTVVLVALLFARWGLGW